MRIPATAPTIPRLLESLDRERMPLILERLGEPAVDGRYLHWEEVRRRTPPADLSREEWWLTLKLARISGRRELPFRDVNGRPFSYVLTDEALSLLHRIDIHASGRLETPEVIVNEATRDRYLVSSLMEEAIASSLLEGAATTRSEAKELLQSGRRPVSRSERMVVNNYRTMQCIRQDLDQPLSVDMILEIHRIITEDTLDDPEDAGRIQQPGERRVDVGDPLDEGVVFHAPPPADELQRLLEKLVEFADRIDDEPFVHPVVRAVALHFYLAYLHPFVDGNGRAARALFYRSMLRQGYWLAEFISISRLLYRAPTQYGRAFLYAETDEADFTYFLLHQLDVIWRAIEDLLAYLEAKVGEVQQLERALRGLPGLNHRQVALLSHALRHPRAIYTFQIHATSHSVTYQTARTDLLGLEELGLLERGQVGRQFRFYPTPDLASRIRDR